MCNDITLDSENKDILKDVADSISEGFLNEKDSEKWFEDMTNRFNNKNQSTRLN